MSDRDALSDCFHFWRAVDGRRSQCSKCGEIRRSPCDEPECVALRARVEELERAIRQMLDVDSEMGIYPAAVSGYNDERDYAQRDGFKNGWNAAVMNYGEAMSKIATATLAQQEGEG